MIAVETEVGFTDVEGRQPIDCYGPFLDEEHIARQQPGLREPAVELCLGSYFLQVEGGKPIEPRRHERFILNALLLQSTGSILQRQLYGLGFFPNSQTVASRQVTLTNSTKSLIAKLNSGNSTEIIYKSGTRQAPIINLEPLVRIVKVSDEEIGPVPKEKKSKIPTLSNLDPSYPDQEEVRYLLHKSIERFIWGGKNGKQYEPPIIGTEKELILAKRIMTGFAGTFEKGSQEEKNFMNFNDLLREFEYFQELEVFGPASPPANSNARVLQDELIVPRRPWNYPEGQEWKVNAACADTTVSLFFARTSGLIREEVDNLIARAKQICAHCPVTHECLDFALDRDIAEGVWGGLDEKERKRISNSENEN
jgi:WhiB family transcriptional regulator, redox-sensing transcriptional regulator